MDLEDTSLKASVVKAINDIGEKLRQKEEAEEESLYKYQNLQQEIALEKAKLDQLKLSLARNQPLKVDASVFNFKNALLAERKKALESLLEEKDHKKLRLEEIEIALENKRREVATPTAQQAAGWVPTVAERLGCRIDRRDEEQAVDIAFWNIDPEDSEREFIFSLGLQQHHPDRYVVLECEPYMPELEQLVNLLNRTSSLPQFMTAMRQAFKSRCRRGSPQWHHSTPIRDSYEDCQRNRVKDSLDDPLTRRYYDAPRYRVHRDSMSSDDERDVKPHRDVKVLSASSPMDMFRTVAQGKGDNTLFLTPTRKGIAHF